MDELFESLRSRHPLLSAVFVSADSSAPESLPPIFSLFLSACANNSKPLCFVVPRRGELARHAALLLALDHVGAQAHAELNREKFSPGERVRIHPSRRVFVFEGVREGEPNRFWLRTLNGNGAIAFPLGALTQLERTTRTHPVGTIAQAHELWAPPTAPIDCLLDTATQGNLAGFGTAVIILDTLSGFTNFADRVGFALSGDEPTILPASDLPLGIAGYDFEHREIRLERLNAGLGEAPPLITRATRSVLPRSGTPVVHGNR